MGIAVILLWDSCVCCGIAARGAEIAAVWMWSSCGLDMESSCTIARDCCDIPMVFCVIPVGLLGYSWGIVGGSLWYYFDIAVEMLWYCCDIAVGFLWDCFENAGIAVVTRLLWKSIEEVVRQFH